MQSSIEGWDDGEQKRRLYFWLAVVFVSLIAVCVIKYWQQDHCIPPPPCSTADAQAGRCTPQHYPCIER